MTLGTSLIAQWLRPHAPNAGGLGLVPGQRTRSHMAQLKILYAAISKQLRPASAKYTNKMFLMTLWKYSYPLISV